MIYPSWYGAWIVAGIIFFVVCLRRNSFFSSVVSYEQTIDLVFFSIMVGVGSGRVLFMIDCWDTVDSWTFFFRLNEPGFSVLGSVVGVFCALIVQLYFLKVPFLKTMDSIALYVPLLHVCGRIGCFCVGCCYGVPCLYPWAVTYTQEKALAPLHVALHPTQLYSALSHGILFVILFFCYKRFKKPGIIACLYGIGISVERFFVDFLRDDRILIAGAFSSSQIVAFGIGMMASIGIIMVWRQE